MFINKACTYVPAAQGCPTLLYEVGVARVVWLANHHQQDVIERLIALAKNYIDSFFQIKKRSSLLTTCKRIPRLPLRLHRCLSNKLDQYICCQDSLVTRYYSYVQFCSFFIPINKVICIFVRRNSSSCVSPRQIFC